MLRSELDVAGGGSDMPEQQSENVQFIDVQVVLGLSCSTPNGQYRPVAEAPGTAAA